MSQISGLTIQRTRAGKVTKLTLSARRWGHLIEDILDRIAVEKNKDKAEVDWEVVKKKLDKKHRVKK
jgi:predicted ATP-dependent protease